MTLPGIACAGPDGFQGASKQKRSTTITFWHGWSAEAQVRAVNEAVSAFELKHPNIKVEIVADADDGKVKDVLRRRGAAGAPDVLWSSSTDNLSLFCAYQVLTDLGPYLAKSGIKPELAMPERMVDRTRYGGTQCALPLLGGAYGLYYNKDAFAEAGITSPPETISEFTKVAMRLSKIGDDGAYKSLGFMPLMGHYQNSPSHFAAQWSPTYFDVFGRSNISRDPGFEEMLTWQKNLVDKLGGSNKLERFRRTLGEEWSGQNAFAAGQVAMQLDGGWRLAMLSEAKVDFKYGVAPFPVPDEQVDSYGKGPTTVAMIAIPAASTKKDAAWELARFLTTDTETVVDLSNAFNGVPSTFAALTSRKLDRGPAFETLLDIAEHPDSSSNPSSTIGDGYLKSFLAAALAYQSGLEPDPRAALRDVDRRINAEIEQASPELPSGSRTTQR